MAKEHIIKINGTIAPNPSDLSYGVQDLDASAERNAVGTTVRDRIAVKNTLDAEYAALTGDDAQRLLQLISDEFFELEYPHPTHGIYNGTFYVGDRTLKLTLLNKQNLSKTVWTEVSVPFVER